MWLPETLTAIASWALVAVTFWMARRQVQIGEKQVALALDLAKQQADALRSELKARLQLQFADRFDSHTLIAARRELAQNYLHHQSHEEIQETVLDFFEDMGLFWRREYLDEELIWSTFGFYGVRWWAICKNYILQERKAQNDLTLFDDFESLTQMFVSRDKAAGNVEADDADLKRFLEAELKL